MKTRLFKISIVLLVSGLIIFFMSASILELERVVSDDMILPQNLALINTVSVFVGIPAFLVGAGFLVGSFVTKFPAPYVVSLSGVVFVSVWILFILSRFS